MLQLKQLAAAGFLLMHFSAAAQYSISGNIRNSSVEKIPGATVRVENTFLATQTNADGNYSIEDLKPGTYYLHVTFIGYQPVHDTVSISMQIGNSIENNYTLSENAQLMDEVVVASTRVDENSAMAYGTLSREQIMYRHDGYVAIGMLILIPAINALTLKAMVAQAVR